MRATLPGFRLRSLRKGFSEPDWSEPPAGGYPARKYPKCIARRVCFDWLIPAIKYFFLLLRMPSVAAWEWRGLKQSKVKDIWVPGSWVETPVALLAAGTWASRSFLPPSFCPQGCRTSQETRTASANSLSDWSANSLSCPLVTFQAGEKATNQ